MTSSFMTYEFVRGNEPMKVIEDRVEEMRKQSETCRPYDMKNADVYKFIEDTLLADNDRNYNLLKSCYGYLKPYLQKWYCTDYRKTETLKYRQADPIGRMVMHKLAAFYGLEHGMDQMEHTMLITFNNDKFIRWAATLDDWFAYINHNGHRPSSRYSQQQSPPLTNGIYNNTDHSNGMIASHNFNNNFNMSANTTAVLADRMAGLNLAGGAATNIGGLPQYYYPFMQPALQKNWGVGGKEVVNSVGHPVPGMPGYVWRYPVPSDNNLVAKLLSPKAVVAANPMTHQIAAAAPHSQQVNCSILPNMSWNNLNHWMINNPQQSINMAAAATHLQQGYPAYNPMFSNDQRHHPLQYCQVMNHHPNMVNPSSVPIQIPTQLQYAVMPQQHGAYLPSMVQPNQHIQLVQAANRTGNSVVPVGATQQQHAPMATAVAALSSKQDGGDVTILNNNVTVVMPPTSAAAANGSHGIGQSSVVNGKDEAHRHL